MKTVLLLTLLGAASLFAQTVPAPEITPDTLIVLQRGACEQRCAVYRLTIFADGTVVYEGRYFVRTPGLKRSLVSATALAGLLRDLVSGGFFEMAGDYGYASRANCQSFSPGEPSAILTVSTGGRSRTVLHNHGCAGKASARLTELEDKVDRAVGVARWIK